MNITVLDGYAANPGDLSWDWLNAYGSVTVYERTPPELVYERAKDSEILFLNKVVIDADMISRLDKLRYIGLLSTGSNVVDVKTAAERGVAVTNVPEYSTGAVAQSVFALILEHTNMVARHSASVHAGDWAASEDFCYWLGELTELEGKTIGIIGFGKIGRRVARLAEAFGMRALVFTPHPKRELETDTLSFTSLDELLRSSDFVSLHCPLTPETHKIVNADFLARMKRTAMLINTARGASVDEEALADALKNGVIACAGIDVMEQEPPRADSPLFECDNCIITPHIAWAGYETRIRLMETVRSNFETYIFKGEAVNNVAKKYE